MTRKRKGGTGREGGRFIALPHSVMESPAFLRLSHHARALLLEFAFQYRGDDNGRLLCSGNYLAGRGWNSNDTITKAKRELLEAGFIHETVKGSRPNKASWYAVTWQTLDRLDGYDPEAAKSFRRGAYRDLALCKIDALTPPAGVGMAAIAPPTGVGTASATPPTGAMKKKFRYSSTPPNGDPLEKPSTALNKTDDKEVSPTDLAPVIPMPIGKTGDGLKLAGGIGPINTQTTKKGAG